MFETFALPTITIFAILATALAVWLFILLVRRERQLGAYRAASFDPASYAIPDAQVDRMVPEQIKVGDSFVLVGMLDVPRLQRFTVDYLNFLIRFRSLTDALSALLNGTGDPEKVLKILNNRCAFNFILKVVDNAILKNAVANPNKIKLRYFRKMIEPDWLQRCMFALWTFNCGEHFKKKLELQLEAVRLHTQWDLSGRPSSA